MRLSLSQRAPRCLRLARNAQASCIRHYATPVEYKPPGEKDPQLGDYPQLPFVSTQLRPAKGWWDGQMRRNFGEPIHEENEALNMWSPDPPHVEPAKALRHFTIAMLGITALGYLIYINVPERIAVPREYPFSGLVKELGGVEENRANPESEDADVDE